MSELVDKVFTLSVYSKSFLGGWCYEPQFSPKQKSKLEEVRQLGKDVPLLHSRVRIRTHRT